MLLIRSISRFLRLGRSILNLIHVNKGHSPSILISQDLFHLVYINLWIELTFYTNHHFYPLCNFVHRKSKPQVNISYLLRTETRLALTAVDILERRKLLSRSVWETTINQWTMKSSVILRKQTATLAYLTESKLRGHIVVRPFWNKSTFPLD